MLTRLLKSLVADTVEIMDTRTWNVFDKRIPRGSDPVHHCTAKTAENAIKSASEATGIPAEHLVAHDDGADVW